MEKELFGGIGRGYLLAALLIAGFIVMIAILAIADTPTGSVEKWVELYIKFSAPILAVVVIPKELVKAFKKKNGETK